LLLPGPCGKFAVQLTSSFPHDLVLIRALHGIFQPLIARGLVLDQVNRSFL